MTDDEAKEILQQIVDLSSLLGWRAVIAQTSEGDISGIIIGSESYLKTKTGKDPLKPIH